MTTRPAAVADRFYPADPDKCAAFLEQALQENHPVPGCRAIIVPHAGYSYSGRTAGQAFSTVPKESFSRAILIGPSHYERFDGISLAPYDAYETPFGDLAIDQELAKKKK